MSFLITDKHLFFISITGGILAALFLCLYVLSLIWEAKYNKYALVSVSCALFTVIDSLLMGLVLYTNILNFFLMTISHRMLWLFIFSVCIFGSSLLSYQYHFLFVDLTSSYVERLGKYLLQRKKIIRIGIYVNLLFHILIYYHFFWILCVIFSMGPYRFVRLLFTI